MIETIIYKDIDSIWRRMIYYFQIVWPEEVKCV